MINWTSEVVHIAWQDKQKIGLLCQNGSIELYTLKPATKADTAQLLESETHG